MGQSGKVSGRGGWKTQYYHLGAERELNQWQKTAYEEYSDYCQRVCGYPGAPDSLWYAINMTITPRSL